MIGVMFLEWAHKVSKPRNERLVQATAIEHGHVSARNEIERRLAEIGELILIEDAKTGADYNSTKIYDLIAEEEFLIDKRNAEHFGALVAGADRVIATSR